MEKQIDHLLQQGNLRAAAVLAVEAYGPELLGFLVTFLHDQNDANEVFSGKRAKTCGAVSRSFRRSLFAPNVVLCPRTSCGVALSSISPHRDPRRRVPLSEMADVAEQVRSRTLPHLRTDVKDCFASIRDALEKTTARFWYLRVDRDMSWNDIARISSADGDSDETLTRVAAKMRKRFQFVKEEIRRRAREAGLLSDEEP